MSNGVILIANNNGSIDYVKQAMFLVERIRKFMNVPVSIITDSPIYLKDNFDTSVVDNILTIDYKNTHNKRFYFDGAMAHKLLQFKNHSRSLAYDLSPYDKTIVMDTDFIVSNDSLCRCFESTYDLMMYKDCVDLSGVRDMHEFRYISDKSVDFYWATVVYFEKNEKNSAFFDLVAHIEQEWNHYKKIYQIQNAMFRNDFAFSIAAHIMQGFQRSNDVVKPLPGKHFFTTDKDILWKMHDDYMMFLIEKKDHLGEYTPISTKGLNVHVMNKFSLERCIQEQECIEVM